MLSSSEVLPERYGPHSATTRCAPLPGLPPGIVSVLMSFMTTSSVLRRSCAEKLRTLIAPELYGRSEALLSIEMLSLRATRVNRPVPRIVAIVRQLGRTVDVRAAPWLEIE